MNNLRKTFTTLLLIAGTAAWAQLPSLTYSKKPAILKGEVVNVSGVDSVRLSYQPVVGGKPVSMAVALEQGRYELSADIRTTQTVTLTLVDPSKGAREQVSANVLLIPGETLTLSADGKKMPSEGKRRAWTTSGAMASLNGDMANFGKQYSSRALYASINGMGLQQMRGKTMKDYEEKLYDILQEAQNKLDADKNVGADFRDYARTQYEMMYGIMLSGGERIMMYANGGKGDFKLTPASFARFIEMNPLQSNGSLYGDLGVAALEVSSRLSTVANHEFKVPECVKELVDAQALVRQIEDFRQLTDEQKATLSTVLPTYDDVVMKKNAELLNQIEENKKNTTFSIQELSDTLTGKRIFQGIIDRYRGKPVLVDFWATWCGPCKAAMKTVIPVKEELWDKVHFVYVTGTTSPKATWNTTITDIHGDHFYVTQEQWQTLLDQFQAQGIPAYVVVNAKGQVQKRFIGFPGVDEIRAELMK